MSRQRQALQSSEQFTCLFDQQVKIEKPKRGLTFDENPHTEKDLTIRNYSISTVNPEKKSALKK